MDPAALPPRDECVTAALLERWARERPEAPFVQFADGETWTFAETFLRARQAAAGLKRLGVGQGGHVLAWLPNGREAILTWFGANLLGAVFVPMNTAYRGNLLQHTIALSQAEVLVAHADYVPRLAEISTGRLRHAVVVGGTAALPAQLRGHGPEALAPEDVAAAERPPQPWDPIYVIFTSGTTGPSKAVVCTYVQVWSGATQALPYFKPEHRILAHLPLFHVAGTGAVMDRLSKGGTCVLLDGFKADAFWDMIRRFNINGCCLIGAMTRFLLKQPPSARDRDHPLRYITTVPWNQDSMAVAERYGLEMYTAFNMTEISTPILADVANPAQLGTCGRPRAGAEVRIVDANDMEVPVGQVGELIIRMSRPWEITTCYLGDPEATARAWRNGWFHTGDAFRRDAAGYYYFVDRMKDAIRRRGENISSFEVESEATGHPSVREAAAVPVPSEFGEDEVLLIVAPVPGRAVDPAELLTFLAPRMAHFALPRYIRVLDDLPKTPTAKVEKHKLRTQGLTPDTWDREAHGFSVRGGRLRAPT